MLRKFEDILAERFGVPAADFEKALTIKREKGGRTGDILVDRKVLTEVQLLEAYSAQYEIPYRSDLSLARVDGGISRRIPIRFLKQYRMVPLFGENSRNVEAAAGDSGAECPASPCTIALNDPSCLQAVDDLARMIGVSAFSLVLSTRAAILSAINLFYDSDGDSAEQLVNDLEEEAPIVIGDIGDSEDLLDDSSDAPIIRLVNHVILQSVKARASDIHIEPSRTRLKVRYRVDGILYDLLTPPKWIQPALISRIKIMAKLNIAEKRLPQDGRMDIKISDQEIDVRVSTLPTSHGERVVLRLLNKSSSLFGLSELGLTPQRLQLIKRLVESPNGIVLVTGPTGSGKTTTLYAVLSSINSPGVNIITIEDPVEYQLDGVSQIQVNPKIDLTFSRGLRSIVRQDPDVILVGEIRDRETAEISAQSALTGHLVFSTLHTNDSATAVTRLVDLGVEPFLITSSVLAVMAQRLVRVLCPDCKVPYDPDRNAMETMGLSPLDAASGQLHRACGCGNCFSTGYRGRIGIFEIMEMNAQLKSLILQTSDANVIQQAAYEGNMKSLREDGIGKVLTGRTTFEEVIRVTR